MPRGNQIQIGIFMMTVWFQHVHSFKKKNFKTIEYYLMEYEHLAQKNDEGYDHYITIGKLNAIKKE
jgi:hypothetical protein